MWPEVTRTQQRQGMTLSRRGTTGNRPNPELHEIHI